jgi:NAD(P)H-nitrite reductase large subunit
VLVCHCHRVNHTRIEKVLDAGADGVRGVVRATKAGSGCGGCIPMLRELCASQAADRAAERACELHADEALAG